MSNRGQSETVGVVLLLGVVVIIVSLVSAAVLADIDREQTPLADLDISADETDVRLVHAGGDTFDTEAVAVVVRDDDESTRFRLDDANLTDRDGDGRFGPGDEFARAHGLDGESAQVTVVHRPTNTVLAERTVTLSDREF